MMWDEWWYKILTTGKQEGASCFFCVIFRWTSDSIFPTCSHGFVKNILRGPFAMHIGDFYFCRKQYKVLLTIQSFVTTGPVLHNYRLICRSNSKFLFITVLVSWYCSHLVNWMVSIWSFSVLMVCWWPNRDLLIKVLYNTITIWSGGLCLNNVVVFLSPC